MALPLILSLLGSGAAGAGLLGGSLLASPLIAGAIGSGLGTAIQEKDLGAGIRAGLTAGALGGLGGMFAGGAGAATAAGGATAGQLGTVGQGLGAGGANVVPGMLGEQAAREAARAGATGLRGAMATMPSGFQPSVFRPEGFAAAAQQGLNQGILSGAGIGAAIPGAIQAMTPTMPEPEKYQPTYGEAMPFERNVRRPPPGFRPGIDSEFQYFDRYSVPMPPRLAGGGMLRYTPAGMNEPMRMRAGGIADMMPGAEREAPQMNDKDIVQESIRAIKGELPEQAAAVVLGQFLQTFGEEAFRKLVDDVQSGRADAAGGDMEGTIRGPGDGMDDLVPATMDDGSQDVLLSDGEFIVPADVVSGLGNGSTDAGAAELDRMMDRVRQERTGRTEQAKQVRAGGLMPA
jgi:hypothetical protein